MEWCLLDLCESTEVLGDPTGEVTLDVAGVLKAEFGAEERRSSKSAM